MTSIAADYCNAWTALSGISFLAGLPEGCVIASDDGIRVEQDGCWTLLLRRHDHAYPGLETWSLTIDGEPIRQASHTVAGLSESGAIAMAARVLAEIGDDVDAPYGVALETEAGLVPPRR